VCACAPVLVIQMRVYARERRRENEGGAKRKDKKAKKVSSVIKIQQRRSVIKGAFKYDI
jgi:hypothetical protein